MVSGEGNYTDQAKTVEAWSPITKRQAKLINPFLFEGGSTSHLEFFTCKWLVKGVGCSVRDTDKHPDVCKIYMGGNDYSPTCDIDINMIARC